MAKNQLSKDYVMIKLPVYREVNHFEVKKEKKNCIIIIERRISKVHFAKETDEAGQSLKNKVFIKVH